MWSTTLLSGEVASTIKYTATTTNLGGAGPFTSQGLLVTTGFVALADPGENDPNIRYTGNTTTRGLRHPSNHNASPELHAFVRALAALYNARAPLEVIPTAQGSFGLNDMSITTGGIFDIEGNWSMPHQRHRFGTDCDIDRNVLLSDGVTYKPIRWRLFERIVDELDGIPLLESGGRLHVQVPEYEVATILLRETR